MVTMRMEAGAGGGQALGERGALCRGKGVDQVVTHHPDVAGGGAEERSAAIGGQHGQDAALVEWQHVLKIDPENKSAKLYVRMANDEHGPKPGSALITPPRRKSMCFGARLARS